MPGSLDTMELRQAVEALTMLTHVDIQKEIYEGRIKRRRDEKMVLNAIAQAEARLEEARVRLAEAEARTGEARARLAQAETRAGEAKARLARAEAAMTEDGAPRFAEGVLVGRIEFAQKLLRRDVTPRPDLEAMSLEALEALAAQLERELAG